MKTRDETERAQRFSHFTIERAPDAIFWIDAEGVIYRVNEAACRMLGYSEEALTGMKVYDLSPDDNIEQYKIRWQKTRDAGVLNYEWQFLDRSGKLLPVEIMRNYIEFEGKGYSCSFVRDISERKAMERSLQEAYADVERLKNRLQEENVYLQHEIKLTHNFEEIIGRSPAIKSVLAKVEQVAATDSTILITGETGTGKELVARAVHYISSRRTRPLVKVNCAALPVNLIESELFGHEKGAFTGAYERKTGRFELADKGTLFLDEIGDLPMDMQVKLLRVLQDGEFERLGDPATRTVDVRIITATNRDLEALVAEGTFREDLYYRLNIFPIAMPPLRARKQDIPILVNHFIQKYTRKTGKKIDSVAKSVMKKLETYMWPGNVRELENVIERAVIVNQGPRLYVGNWLPKTMAHAGKASFMTLEEKERSHIIDVLQSTGWKVSGDKGAAELLDINPNTLVSRMKKLGINRPNKKF